MTNEAMQAAQQWAAEMLDQPTQSGRWTAFEVGEYHSAGISAVPASQRDRLDKLFAAAGGERALAAYLNSFEVQS